MKNLTFTLGAAALFGLAVITPNPIFGQVPVETSTTTTTTSSGTVSELTPDAMALRIDTSPVPVRYTFTKTTTYVDENGNPVSVETVKSGVPVVVYYEKSGNGFVADKVVVKKSVSTTTDVTPAVVAPQSLPPSTDGIVTDADSDVISIRTAGGDRPIHYHSHDSTTYVDETGNPIARKSLRAGMPVTIFYEPDGDDLRATRVIVKNPTIIEKTTTTTRETTVPR